MEGVTGTNCGTTKIAVSAEAAKIVHLAMVHRRPVCFTGASAEVTAIMPHLISGPALVFNLFVS
jgi:hypothetical protein